jgi:hypothetical protein
VRNRENKKLNDIAQKWDWNEKTFAYVELSLWLKIFIALSYEEAAAKISWRNYLAEHRQQIFIQPQEISVAIGNKKEEVYLWEKVAFLLYFTLKMLNDFDTSRSFISSLDELRVANLFTIRTDVCST